MNAATAEAPEMAVVYPESDGKPMADNTRQARWIFVFFGNLSALFDREADVFVAADLLWYCVQGQPEVRIAPDVLVVFGRPKGDRGSYKQWEEADVPVTVVFEILSPGNTPLEMINKQFFYEDHGVEEYYLFDPETNTLVVYLRQGEMLRPTRHRNIFVSPRLGIRFDLTGPEMQVFYPDGRRFLTFVELEAERARQNELRLAAEEKLQTTEEKLQTTEEKLQAAEQRWQRLSELSRKARRGQAGPEEIAELERLENETNSLSS